VPAASQPGAGKGVHTCDAVDADGTRQEAVAWHPQLRTHYNGWPRKRQGCKAGLCAHHSREVLEERREVFVGAQARCRLERHHPGGTADR